MSTSENIVAALILNSLPGVGPVRFQHLIDRFESPRQALNAGVNSWLELSCFDSKLINLIRERLDSIQSQAISDIASLEVRGGRIYCSFEGPYPTHLRNSRCPPPIIYSVGDDLCDAPAALAVVGSRNCTYYGEKTTRLLINDLSAAGLVIVSGLARGIDTFAHEAALRSGGKTWAVIGSGLSEIYPSQNKRLADRIAAQGALLSEFPMTTKALPAHFPRRNRIIACLTIGTLVIEGAEKSGSLITARLAAEEGRDVFAVPGPITSPLSFVPHLLIDQGAKLVTCADDVLNSIGIKKADTKFANSHPNNLEREQFLPFLNFISEEPISRDSLAERLKMNTGELAAVLTEMELKGIVKKLPGGNYVLC